MTDKSKLWDIGVSNSETDTSTSHYQYREFRDRGITVNDTVRDFEIDVNLPDNYILPSEAYIVFKCKITKAAGGDYAAADLISVVNNFAASFFDTVEYSINDQVIENNRYNHIQTFVHNLVESSPEYAKSFQNDEGWYLDTGANDSAETRSVHYSTATVADFDPVVTVTTLALAITGATAAEKLVTKPRTNYNSGFITRQALMAVSKEVYFKVPLNRLFGFCRSINHVFIGNRHTLRMHRQSNDSTLLFRTGTADGQINLSALSLWMPILKPSVTEAPRILKSLSENVSIPMTYDVLQTYRSSSAFDKATQNPSWTVSTLTEKPKYVYVFAQTFDRVNNAQTVNPMVFDCLYKTNIAAADAGIKSVSVKLGSKQFPEYPLRVNMTAATPDYIRAYHDLLELSHPDGDINNGGQINLTNFRQNFPIFAIDLSAQDESLFSTSGSTAELVVDVELRDACEKNYYLWAVVCSERRAVLNIINKQVSVVRK